MNLQKCEELGLQNFNTGFVYDCLGEGCRGACKMKPDFLKPY